MYPRLVIDLNKYKENARFIKKTCHENNMSLTAVTKVFCGNQKLVDIISDLSIDYIGDSRILNLKNMRTHLPKVLLRLPSIHEAADVIEYSDISLNSEFKTIQALNQAAKTKKQTHKIVLMIDIGDLREGIYYKERIMNVITKIEQLSNIDLFGIGTNITCFGGIIPSIDTLKKLTDTIDLIENELDKKFAMVSGGNSSHLHLLFKNEHIPRINNLRIGEAIALGRETAYGEPIKAIHQDVFILEASLIELKHKPSMPEGNVGMNAFGQRPMFDDLGLMRRGIIALGKQDVDFHELIPFDQDIRLIGSSSDHVIIDLTHTKHDYRVGDILRFKLTYGSLLSLMTSQYVEKVYV